MAYPRVLLIGGPPGAGKTSVARGGAAELGYASLSVDDLVITGRALTTPESHPALQPMRGRGHTAYFTETPPEALIADSAAVADAMWPAVHRVIRGHATVNAPTTIDWWLLSPTRVAEMDIDGVMSVWLHVDPDVLEARERLNKDFLADSPDPERMLSNFMARSRWRNELIARQAEGHGLPVLRQTGNETIDDVVAATLALMSSRASGR